MAGIWYRFGTVTVTNGSKKVTGFGTQWQITTWKVDKGHSFHGPDGKFYEVDYVESDTVLYLVTDYSGITAGSQSYAIDITRTSTIPALSRQISDQLAYAQGQYDSWQQILTGSEMVTLTAPDGQQVQVPSLLEINTTTSGLDARLGSAETKINALQVGQGSGTVGYATRAALYAALNHPDGTIGYVTEDPIATFNGTYRKTGALGTGGWVQAATDLASQAYQISLDTGTLSETNFDTVKTWLTNKKVWGDLSALEKKVVGCLRSFKVRGIDDNLLIDFIISGGVVTAFQIKNEASTFYMSLKSTNIGIQLEDAGVGYYEGSAHYAGKIVYAKVILDIRGVADFSYNWSAENPNLKFKAKALADDDLYTSEAMLTEVLPQTSVLSLKRDPRRVKLISNAMYFKFRVAEPIILGSVLVNVEVLPSVQPSFVECSIYPPDNGFGTAPRITSSDQQQITKTGLMRLPLENKVLQPGIYTIGFKTNALDNLSTVQGVESYRGYDSGNLMPAVAPNPIYPTMDKYAKFVAFDLVEFRDSIAPQKPAKWEVKYEPEYLYIGQTDDKVTNYYLRVEGFSGSKTIKFYESQTGGVTKTAMHSNDLDETQYGQLGSILHGTVRYVTDAIYVYYTTDKGMVCKVVIVAGVATLSDITPPNKSASSSGYIVNSYAPLVQWKGYLWWGEYQDPATPRIHKMNLTTDVWSISIEKPTSGSTGARHVHFLYKSPSNPDVLWANWGDASSGGGQGLSRLEITGASAGSSLDAWVQWTTGLHDANGTTLPYPTAILELYDPGTGSVAPGETVIIGAGDQPPVHLIMARTTGAAAGKYLFQPLSFKQEIVPNTETMHWMAMDADKTIYFMTVESNPYMSFYASPYPYTRTFRIAKYWQQVPAGSIGYSAGYIQTRQYRFPVLKFMNKTNVTDISKTPWVDNATADNIVDQFNLLLDNLRGSNILQYKSERGNDKNNSDYTDPAGVFENWN